MFVLCPPPYAKSGVLKLVNSIGVSLSVLPYTIALYEKVAVLLDA